MPPKPWETKKRPVQNISEIIQSNPTIKEQVPKLPPSQSVPNPNNTSPAASSSTSPSAGLAGSSSYGGYGGYSSYGGMGGGYGGYGGGYSSYGMGMGMSGMGGMYGLGRYSLMGGGQNQKGALYNTMITLDSFSYLINCLCEIARSLDQNYEGLSLFYKSFKNLINRLENSVLDGFKWVINKIKNFFIAIYRFIVENIFFLGRNKNKQKYRAIKIIITLAIIGLSVSFYPLIRKGIKNV